MSTSYVKVFNRLLDSSIWDEDDCTRIVWVTMMVMADEHGEVRTTVNGLASRSRVLPEAAQAAITKFLEPDPASLSAEFEGRRIEPCKDGQGWRLLNHAKYRAAMSIESRREYFRNKRREYRAKEKEARIGMTTRRMAKESMEAADCVRNGGV
jgi:hypothetical protein